MRNPGDRTDRNRLTSKSAFVLSKTQSDPLEMATQTATEPRTHNDYTVGWVCALPKEQTAATAMLDQIHPDLLKPPNDPNTYTLGSIGKHNIVISCLPKGKIGNNSAAIFATQMVRTFPSIKVGLMVGIGGGIPPKVRLGDVVVSAPADQYQGVVQWDFGKTEKGGKFRRTGGLNSPPSALLTALTKMETKSKMNGSKIPQYLEDLEKKWPNLVPEYTRSASLKDPLFTADGSHTDRDRWQAIFSVVWDAILAFLGFLLGWDAYASIDRGADGVASSTTVNTEVGAGRKPGDMCVHYGLIASGNQVIKDAGFRDRLNESLGGNVLCVEMEAAGLMDNFPCIVIRGICDYADSQKNKDWQEHAAAVAAACAKELLEYVQASDVDRERPIKDILGQG
ncbi:purine and uridine phosphorylase [Zopfia rhizophila CBS 207.26]|uniref:Purine and uridine phosphorylase n=1 Tax=Zopfia rhizophila CBS 207.26 TaxID=1314779 RepID=A0A6A6DXH3_9PEZI|nr:purine and uridine phosphorylase [Zopfia rhizophila CBS 207.26]